MKKIIKITLITITTLIILVFTYFIIMGIILATAFNGNYSKKLMKQYQEKEIRINYFKQHEKDFTIIVKTFENYSEINGIKSRCILENEKCLDNKCAVCGRDAKHLVVWGIQY